MEKSELDELNYLIDTYWSEQDDYVSFSRKIDLSAELSKLIADTHWFPSRMGKNGEYFFKHSNSGFRRTAYKRASKLVYVRQFKNGFKRNEALTIELTTLCNKTCTGCYNKERNKNPQFMSNELLSNILNFADRQLLSVEIVGGEPLMDVRLNSEVEKHPDLFFYVVTNGTFFNLKLIDLIEERFPNFVPFLSLEGSKEYNDSIRGPGSYDNTLSIMYELKKRRIPYNIITTITNKNISHVFEDDYINMLIERGVWGLGLYKFRSFEMSPYNLSMENISMLGDRVNELYHKAPFKIYHEEPVVQEDGSVRYRHCNGLLTFGYDGSVMACPSLQQPLLKLESGFDRDQIAAALDSFYREVGLKSNGCPIFFGKEHLEKFYNVRKNNCSVGTEYDLRFRAFLKSRWPNNKN